MWSIIKRRIAKVCWSRKFVTRVEKQRILILASILPPAEMDEILGDSHLIVLKHETEIMYQIARYIQSNGSSIARILDKICLLDW